MPHITLAGVDFELREEPPKEGALLVLARREKRGGNEAMAGYLDFIEALLADHDEAEFEQAISAMDSDEIKTALEEAAETYQVDPTSAGRTPSQDSGGGQSNGARSSRVVSLSRGTVEFRSAG